MPLPIKRYLQTRLAFSALGVSLYISIFTNKYIGVSKETFARITFHCIQLARSPDVGWVAEMDKSITHSHRKTCIRVFDLCTMFLSASEANSTLFSI